MRIRDRLRRAWGWARSLLASPSPAPRVSASPVSLSPTVPKPPPPTYQEPRLPGAGDPLVVGDVTLQLWPVADLVVLATSEMEAERAFVALLAHPDASVRDAAGHRLVALRNQAEAA